jgi:hypothetical protein
MLKEQNREEASIGAKVGESTGIIITRGDTFFTGDLYHCPHFLPRGDGAVPGGLYHIKEEFPDLIAGFDIVGDENEAKPLIDCIKPLLAFKKRVKDLGLDLPFLLHAGETLSDGGKADNNLYDHDALLLGTKRIGHG